MSDVQTERIPLPRRALITGASRGIGRAIAERLAKEGYSLALVARNEVPLEAFANTLRSSGTEARTFAADLADEADVRQVIDAYVGEWSALDVLVLAAGFGSIGPIDSFPLRRLDRLMAVNLRAPFQLVQGLLPAMRAAAALSPDRGAKIIGLASIIGVISAPDLAAYGASKAAMISLCESITVAEGASGVTATAISPGYVDTDMTTWVHDRIPAETMIRTSDVAEMALSITRLSSYAVVPNVVVARPGSEVWRG